MNGLAQIKIELDINAQRMMQQVQLHNQQLESVIKSGIERALSEVLEDDNFEQIVVDLVKNEINSTIKKSITDWSFRRKIDEAISSAIDGKIDILANNFADKALKNISI